MALAVRRLSPVIITTSTPMLLRVCTASADSTFTVSATANMAHSTPAEGRHGERGHMVQERPGRFHPHHRWPPGWRSALWSRGWTWQHQRQPRCGGHSSSSTLCYQSGRSKWAGLLPVVRLFSTGSEGSRTKSKNLQTQILNKLAGVCCRTIIWQKGGFFSFF